jgi:Multicopper oxidase
VTDNPGAWIFHCHVQWHHVVSLHGYNRLKWTILDHLLTHDQSGMAVVLVEGDNELPALLSATNMSTTRPEDASPSSTKKSAAPDLLVYSMYHHATAVSCAAIFVIMVSAFV